MQKKTTAIEFERTNKLMEEVKTMFKFASENNCEEIMKLFLNIGVSDKDILNDALIKAVKSNNKDIARILLDAGADPNANEGECILIAVLYDMLEMADLLIEYKADLSLRNNKAVLFALGEVRNEMFLKLVKTIENVDFLSNSPLLKSVVSMDDISILEYLTEDKKIEINQETKDLMIATASALNKYKFVEYLIILGADVHHNDNQCIKDACYRGHVEAVKALILAGADARVDNDFLICEAAKEGHFHIVALLIDIGLSPNANNGEPLRNAMVYKHKDVADLLRISMNMNVDEETVRHITNMRKNIL